MYGQANFSYRGTLRSAGLCLCRQRRQPEQLARVGLLRHRRPQHEGRLSGLVSEVAAGAGRRTTTQLRYRFNSGVPNAFGYYIAPRWEQNDRTATQSFFVQDQWTKGRLTLQGGLRYDRAWSLGARRAQRHDGDLALQSAADHLPAHRQRGRLQRHHPAGRRGATTCSATARPRCKVNLGKYLQAATNDENYWANNPAGRIVTQRRPRAAGWTATATTSSIAT